MNQRLHCPSSGDRARRALRLCAALLLALLVISSGPAPCAGAGERAGQGIGAPAVPLWPHLGSDLQPDPRVFHGRLPNGLRYALMPNGEPRERVSLHLMIQAGSLVEEEHQRGWAHYLEHMLFNGSERFAPGELVKYFQEIGMQFGPDANARTGFHETIFDILLPRASEESLRQGLEVLRDWADGASLLPDEVERERRVVLAEKRSRDSADYRTYLRTLAFELPEARLSRRLPIGEESALLGADAAGLRDFYGTWYRPETMVVVAVGEIAPQTLARLIETVFGGMRARTPARERPPFGRLRHQGVQAFFHHEGEAGAAQVGIEVLSHAPSEPDTRARRREELLQDLASQMIQHRLDAALREPAAPFTSASVGAGRMLREIRFAEIAADCPPENWAATLTALETTLRTALVHGFSDQELERVRQEMRAGLDRAVERAPTRESTLLARGIMGHLAEGRVFLSPEQQRDLLLPMLDTLERAEVEQALRRDWSPDHRLLLLTGNAEPGSAPGETERRLEEVYGRSAAVAVAPPEAAAQVRFPYLPDPPLAGAIAARERIADLGLQLVTFANGVHLQLKPTDFKADEVWANLTFGAGRSAEPPDKAGLSSLAVDLAAESGLGGLDRDQLARALAGKSAAVNLTAEEDRFVLRGRSRRGELELLFQLLYAHLVDPGFRPEAFALVRRRYAQYYEELQRTVEGAMQLRGQRFLAGEDSRFGLPPREQFWQLQLDDVRGFLMPLLEAEPLEISVVGDFDPEEALRLAARTLGALPPRRSAPGVPRPGRPHFPAARSLELRVPTRIPKGLAVVAYQTDDAWSIGRSRRLSVLADVLSDRLRETIREKLGAAYAPDAGSFTSRAYPGYGYLRAEVETDPAQAGQVLEEIRAIVAGLVRDGVRPEELRRALNPTLTGLKTTRRRNGYWLNQVLTGASRHPQQLEWSRTMLEDYQAVTSEELTDLARTYLQAARAAAIVVRPEEGVAADPPSSGAPRPAAAADDP